MLYEYLKTTNGVNIVLQEDIQIYEFVWERVIVYNSVLFILFICIYYEYFAPYFKSDSRRTQFRQKSSCDFVV